MKSTEMRNPKTMHIDKASTLDWPQLIDATGLSMGELAMVVMDLELKGLIRALPGKRYERV